MSSPSNHEIAQLLLESLNQISNTAVSHRRTGGELEDSAMAAFIDQLNLSENSIYNGLKDLRERAGRESNRPAEKVRIAEAKKHEVLTKNLRQVLEQGAAPIDGEATIFIKHPLGKQNWPEFVLYHNGKVLPIEVKSSADGKIVWNGGLPRPGCLYVYFYTRNQAEGRRSTVFFGEDIITQEVYNKLRENHAKVQEFARQLHSQSFPSGQDMGFSEYARAMYNHSEKIHGNPKASVWQASTRLKIAKWAGADKKLTDELRAALQREIQAQKRSAEAGKASNAPEGEIPTVVVKKVGRGP